MTEYEASNGIGVRIDDQGDLDFHTKLGWNGLCGGKVVDALREFFQYERDEELGRWRARENPAYVVYPDEDGDVIVLDETTGRTSSPVLRSELAQWNPTHGTTKAARAYFEAHPERKPWEEAMDGEIWEFSLGCSSGQYLADSGRFFQLPLRAPSHPGWKPASFPNDFEHGERIWPEDAS